MSTVGDDDIINLPTPARDHPSINFPDLPLHSHWNILRDGAAFSAEPGDLQPGLTSRGLHNKPPLP